MPALRTLACLVVAVVAVLATTPQAAAQPSGGPVTYAQVLNLVELKIDDDAIIKRLNGTTFVLDATQEQALRNAGATDRLIQALKAAPSLAQAQGGSNWVFILDCSGSMQEATPDKIPKMEAAKKAVISVLKNTPNGVNVGFIIYGHDAALKCEAVKVLRPLAPLDDDGKADLALAVTNLKPAGHTPIALALQVARKQLEGREGGANGVVLITDGLETCHGDPVAEAGRIDAKQGVHVIGFGLTPDEAKSVKAIAAAGKGKFYDAKTAADLATEMQVVQAKVRETVAKPAPKPNRASVQALSETTVDKPATLELGATGKAALDKDASAYVAVRLAADAEYTVTVDVRQSPSTNILGRVTLLDEDGAEVQRNLIKYNEIDYQFRKVAHITVKAAGKYICRITNDNVKADFWITVRPVPVDPAPSLTATDLEKYDPKTPGLIPVPFHGEMLPTLIEPGVEVGGRLEAGGAAYYIARLPQGNYKAVIGLTNARGRNTNIQGYLGLLDGDGGNQTKIIGFNEIDATTRKSGEFSLPKPGVVILRVQISDEPMKFTLRLRPASE